MRYLATVLIFLALASFSCPAHALQLPLKPGVFWPSDDSENPDVHPGVVLQKCDGDTVMGWTGHGFESDYIYVERIFKTQKLSKDTFLVYAHPSVVYEGAKPSDVWQAKIKILGKNSFLFMQWKRGEQDIPEDFENYYVRCKSNH